jgi:hypothetical protein
MRTRIGFLKLVTFVAIAAVGFAPATAQAQSNRGQLVQAVVRLNQVQLTFAKKLAEDPAFATQFDQATSSGNFDAAASLAASATGLPKSSIYVGRGTGNGHDNHDAASAAATAPKSIFQTASFTRPNERKQTTGKICFRLIIAEGCIAW